MVQKFLRILFTLTICMFLFTMCETVTDTDGDGVPDTTDNCIDQKNSDQLDIDEDEVGFNDYATFVSAWIKRNLRS